MQEIHEELKVKLAVKLREILPDDGERDFVTASQWMTKLSAPLKKNFGFRGKNNASKMRDILTPYLPEGFEFRKGPRTIYLARRFSNTDLLFRYITNNPGKTLGVLFQSLPMVKRDCRVALNELLAARRLILSVNDSDKVQVYAFAESALDTTTDITQNVPAVSIPETLTITQADAETFRDVFQKLDKGRLFVPITELRKTLPWTKEKFDEVLRVLCMDKVIQLHIADRSKMTDEEWADTFVDENGYHMRRVTWNEKR